MQHQYENQITSSPVSTEMNPLTVRITSSPISEQSECFTPVKQGQPQVDNLSSGLLTYSTPIVYSQNFYQAASAFQAYELLKRSTPYSIFNSFNQSKSLSSEKRKPRVNFHSIDDLANSEDSGIASNVSSNMSKSTNESSPALIQSQFNKKLDEVEQEEEEKENIENNKKQQLNENGKKFRTTFTDQQKKALEVYFQKNPYPDPKETEDLSQQLVLPENVIKVWFQNKRSRDKQRKFSHKSRQQNNTSTNVENNVYNQSPIVANLQLLTSRLNTYATLAAAVNAVNSNQNYYNQKF